MELDRTMSCFLIIKDLVESKYWRKEYVNNRGDHTHTYTFTHAHTTRVHALIRHYSRMIHETDPTVSSEVLGHCPRLT